MFEVDSKIERSKNAAEAATALDGHKTFLFIATSHSSACPAYEADLWQIDPPPDGEGTLSYLRRKSQEYFETFDPDWLWTYVEESEDGRVLGVLFSVQDGRIQMLDYSDIYVQLKPSQVDGVGSPNVVD